jgi:SAM-dependent methyltransferase
MSFDYRYKDPSVEDAQLSDNVSKPCPTCGSAAFQRVQYEHAADYITGDVFRTLRCSQCELVSTSPLPESLERYYPRSYRRYNLLILAILKTLYRWRVSRWNTLFKEPGSALELGCGDGFMLNALRSKGWSVCGTERTEEMARFAREHFGLTVIVENSTPLSAEKKFDLVIMFQVLEHLADPLQQLSRARALVHERGKVVVCVPNIASWQSIFGKQRWFHLDVPRHLFHYSPASLASLARVAGFNVNSIGFASVEHDPYGWVQTILNVAVGNNNRLTKLLMRMVPWRASDALTVALACVLSPVAFLIAGLSWVCVRGAIMQVVLEPSVAKQVE